MHVTMDQGPYDADSLPAGRSTTFVGLACDFTWATAPASSIAAKFLVSESALCPKIVKDSPIPVPNFNQGLMETNKAYWGTRSVLVGCFFGGVPLLLGTCFCRHGTPFPTLRPGRFRPDHPCRGFGEKPASAGFARVKTRFPCLFVFRLGCCRPPCKKFNFLKD